jgi:hypothetical protein
MLVKNTARKRFVHQLLQREELTKSFLRATFRGVVFELQETPKELQEFFFLRLNESSKSYF